MSTCISIHVLGNVCIHIYLHDHIHLYMPLAIKLCIVKRKSASAAPVYIHTRIYILFAKKCHINI